MSPASDEEDPQEDPQGEPEGEPQDEAAQDQILRDGESAYKLGNFDLAIEKFEAAYGISPQPRLLYNLALTYFRRYDVSEVGLDLHRAKAMLTNFDIELQRDPSLGDSENVQKLLKQLDAKIAAHDLRERELEAAEREAALLEAAEREEAIAQALADEVAVAAECAMASETNSDRQRLVGAALMGVGSVSFAGGIASLAAFTLKSVEFRNRLEVLQVERDELGCAGLDSVACQGYADSIDSTIINGRRANIYAGTIGGALTALGTAGLIVGAVVFAKSDRRAEEDRRARVSVVPGVSGLTVVGRF